MVIPVLQSEKPRLRYGFTAFVTLIHVNALGLFCICPVSVEGANRFEACTAEKIIKFLASYVARLHQARARITKPIGPAPLVL